MRPHIVVRSALRFAVAVLLALGVAFLAAPGAQAATSVSDVAQALRQSPVYVDEAASAELSAADADTLAQQIKDADKPVFVAVLPADFARQNGFADSELFQKLRVQTGITGLYAVQLGDAFDARADSVVLSRDGVDNLKAGMEGTTTAARLNSFTGLALDSVRGSAPASWGVPSDEGVDSGALIGLGAVAVAGGAGAYALVRRSRAKRAEAERSALAKLAVVVDEDITAFGEELDRLDFHPGEPGATDRMRTDYAHALDAYEHAKSLMAAAQRPDDVRAVTQAVEDGRFSLAVLAARREGREPPERRAPCFFDPRHGPSVADVSWAPVGAPTREVPVCAADQARLADGEDPAVRQVDTEHGRRPYYEAGPVYGPWAGGYYGGVLPGLLIGTMLGSLMSGPAYAADGGMGPGAGYDGGDQSGADFGPDDFGGGFGGGDFGGGDFGGGFM
ncbi:hypothetical protein ACX6XY_29490 [Streptomyces sp. O3]